jgi:hypothetical protein
MTTDWVIWIAPDGEFAQLPGRAMSDWPAGTNDENPGPDPITNLGFVALRRSADTMYVRFRPVLLSGETSLTVTRELALASPRHVALAMYDDDRTEWRYQIFGDWRHASERIVSLVMHGERSPRYFSEALALRDLAIAENAKLDLMYRIWRERRDYTAELLMRDELQTQRQRTIVVAQEPNSDRTVIRYLGSNIKLYGTNWLRSAVGRDFEDQPDPTYAARTVANLRRSVATGEPLFHLNTARIHRDDGGVLSLVYRRLTLPWRGPDGSTIVTVTSLSENRSLLYPLKGSPDDAKST